MMTNDEAIFWGTILFAVAIAYVGLGDCAAGLLR